MVPLLRPDRVVLYSFGFIPIRCPGTCQVGRGFEVSGNLGSEEPICGDRLEQTRVKSRVPAMQRSRCGKPEAQMAQNHLNLMRSLSL